MGFEPSQLHTHKHKIKYNISLSRKLFKALQTHVSPSVTGRLLVFTATMVVRLLVFSRLPWGWKERMGIEQFQFQFKMSQRSCFFLRFSHFSSIHAPWIIESICSFISNVLKKVILTIFATVLISFMEEIYFWRSLLHHSWSGFQTELF